MELFLVKELGYRWDEVHFEAERLEHHISPLFEERIAERLGHPSFDPHGDPIPSAAGEMPSVNEIALSAAEIDSQLVITRLRDNPELLRYVAGLEILPGSKIEIHGRQPFGGPYNILVNGEAIALAPEAAEQIFGKVVA